MLSSSDWKSFLYNTLRTMHQDCHRVDVLLHAGELEAQIFVTFRGVVPLGEIVEAKPEDIVDLLAKAIPVTLLTAEEVRKRREEFDQRSVHAVWAASEKRNPLVVPSKKKGGRPKGSKDKKRRKRRKRAGVGATG